MSKNDNIIRTSIIGKRATFGGRSIVNNDQKYKPTLTKIIPGEERYFWTLPVNAKLEMELSDYVDTDGEFYKCLIEIDKISERIKRNTEGLQKWCTFLNGLKIIPLKI